MLGTFSFEPYFKSYLCFTVWSLEISEIAFGSFSPSSSLLACFPCRRRCAVPPPAVEGQPATSCFALAPTRRAAPLPPPVASLGATPTVPRAPPRPKPPARPPPRRRGGELAAEPAAHSSRAHGYYKNPREPFLSSFCHLLAHRLQNTAAAPPATPASLTPPRSHHCSPPPPALTP